VASPAHRGGRIDQIGRLVLGADPFDHLRQVVHAELAVRFSADVERIQDGRGAVVRLDQAAARFSAPT